MLMLEEEAEKFSVNKALLRIRAFVRDKGWKMRKQIVDEKLEVYF